MAFVEADFARSEARHVYLRGAAALRSDLPRD
jgi:chorismate mutase